jgi:hypothetical protein
VGKTPHDRIKELQRRYGVANVETLLAMSAGNDPFNSGSDGDKRRAEWFAKLWHEQGMQAGTHIRRFHYRLVSLDPPPLKPAPLGPRGLRAPPVGPAQPYQNTEEDWGYLEVASRHARYLDLVPAHHLDDRRNPDPVINYPPEEEPEPSFELGELTPWELPAIKSDLAAELDLPVPEVTVDETSYEYRPCDQAFHLELWIEKSTMNDILEPLCEELGVNLVVGVGFLSITAVVKALKRVDSLRETLGGRPCRILYVSDFDPAGDTMPAVVSRQFEFWVEKYASGADMKLKPLALTAEQCEQYDLPSVPTKPGDSRAAGFQAAYGRDATELDALEALHPGVLENLIREAVAPYRDEGLADRLAEAEAEAQTALDDAWQDATADIREELDEVEEQAREILAKYEERLAALDEELQAELAPLKERLTQEWQAMAGVCQAFDPDLPSRPEAEPDIDESDEDDWLFSSDRTYLEQLRVYKERRGEDADDVPSDDDEPAPPRECGHCGGSLDGVPNDALYCGPDCKRAARNERRKKT